MELFENATKGAVISECGKYRFQLWRIWDNSKPMVFWVMHNPSTADESEDDPTIRRIIGFTKSWGYGGLYVGNLFPYRATNPKQLLNKRFSEISPIENLQHLRDMRKLCELHVLAYGNPIIPDANPIFIDDTWHGLKFTKSGNPCHPLYLNSNLKPIKFPDEFRS